jgi:hypothetical protein
MKRAPILPVPPAQATDTFIRALRTSRRANALGTFYDQTLVPNLVGGALLLVILWLVAWLALHVLFLEGQWLTATLVVAFVASCASFFYNVRFRNYIATQLPAATRIPERRWGYSAADLAQFKTVAAGIPTNDGRSILQIYHGPILLPNDLLFAILLATFVVILGRWLALAFPAAAALFYASAALGFVYGVADVTEDMALARVFGVNDVPAYEARLASLMTRVKIVALSASLTGGLLFLLLQAIGRRVPAKMPSRF